MSTAIRSVSGAAHSPADPRESLGLLLRDLGSTPAGLTALEASRRLARYGPNELSAHTARTWPGQLLRRRGLGLGTEARYSMADATGISR